MVVTDLCSTIVGYQTNSFYYTILHREVPTLRFTKDIMVQQNTWVLSYRSVIS